MINSVDIKGHVISIKVFRRKKTCAIIRFERKTKTEYIFVNKIKVCNSILKIIFILGKG